MLFYLNVARRYLWRRAAINSKENLKRDCTGRAFHKVFSRMILRFTVPEVTFPVSDGDRAGRVLLQYSGVAQSECYQSCCLNRICEVTHWNDSGDHSEFLYRPATCSRDCIDCRVKYLINNIPM